MKYFQNFAIVFLLIAFASPNLSFSQNSLVEPLDFEVKKIYQHITISKTELEEAKTLGDIHNNYKSSWIKEYLSVETETIHQGKIVKTLSKSDVLSQKQKKNIQMADVSSNVIVKVQYMPENNLKNNEPKELDFTFTVAPDNDAAYIGGVQELNQYIKEKAIDQIPEGSLTGYDMSAVLFSINPEGEIVDAHLFDSVYKTTSNEGVENLLLETIKSMPCWKPAAFSNGTKVKQDYVLTVGVRNNKSCLINLLKTYPNGFVEGK